jgi:hypothetical protein
VIDIAFASSDRDTICSNVRTVDAATLEARFAEDERIQAAALVEYLEFKCEDA